MNHDPVACRFCDGGTMKPFFARSHGAAVVMGGRFALVISAALALITFASVFEVRAWSPTSAMPVLGGLAQAGALAILGAMALQRRRVLWCRQCGAITEVTPLGGLESTESDLATRAGHRHAGQE